MTKITNAVDAWSKAAGKLGEAEKADPAATPGAVVHCAYYAMHHGARAVLLAENGFAPSDHGAVVRKFGLLAKERDDQELKVAGRVINKMMEDRRVADYECENPGEAEARDASGKARVFLETCATTFGFSLP